MLLDIVIPTLHRRKKLENCLNSIFLSAKNTKINIYVYFSDLKDLDFFNQQFSGIEEIHLDIIKEYRVPEFWNNHLAIMKADAMVYLNDDILMFEDTIDTIIKEFSKRFPDTDGVMGLRQANIPQDQAVEGAFGVIGRKYADRFKDRQVWCPDYYRFFADFELWRYAKYIGKFHFSIPSRIKHLHPLTDKTLEDSTHKAVRKWIHIDKNTFNKRKEQNLLWGRNFNLLT